MKKSVKFGAIVGMSIVAIIFVFGSKKLNEWNCHRYSKMTGKVTKFDWMSFDGCFIATDKGTFAPMKQARWFE